MKSSVFWEISPFDPLKDNNWKKLSTLSSGVKQHSKKKGNMEQVGNKMALTETVGTKGVFVQVPFFVCPILCFHLFLDGFFPGLLF
jgi:hypothetical protein